MKPTQIYFSVPPIVTVSETNPRIIAGTAATIECSATGTPDPTSTSWYLESNEISTSSREARYQTLQTNQQSDLIFSVSCQFFLINCNAYCHIIWL